MKTNSSLRTLWIGLFALMAISFATRTFASSADYYLEIKDEKGKVTKTKIAADGSFDSPSLSPGVYVCSFQWGVGRGISSPMGGSADRATPKSVSFTYEVKAPRDAASGMATGKRMHKPITLTMEIDRSSSSGKSRMTFQKITIDEACDGLKGKVVVKDTKGGTMAMDDWSQQ